MYVCMSVCSLYIWVDLFDYICVLCFYILYVYRCVITSLEEGRSVMIVIAWSDIRWTLEPELEILDPRTAELFPLLEAQAKETGDARIVNHSSFGRNFTPNKGLEEKLGSEMWKAESGVVQKCSTKKFNLDQQYDKYTCEPCKVLHV